MLRSLSKLHVGNQLRGETTVSRKWIGVLIALSALLLLTLTLNFRAARLTHKAESNQGLARATMGDLAPATGNRLTLYMTGADALSSAFQPALLAALRAKDVIAFTEIELLTTLPDEISTPFLLIRIDRQSGFWTPFYARRHLEAAMHYAQGPPVARGAVEELLASAGDPTDRLHRQTITQSAVDGRRSATLDMSGFGLISLPSLRAYTAERLAEEAAVLVAEAVPEHLNPARWFDRAAKLAAKQWQSEGSTFSTFQAGKECRGGVVLIGDMEQRDRFRFYFYDAERDAITATLTSEEVYAAIQGRADLAGMRPSEHPGSGGTDEHLIYSIGTLPNGANVSLEVSACDVTDWTVK